MRGSSVLSPPRAAAKGSLPPSQRSRHGLRIVDHDAHRRRQLQRQHLQTVKLVERQLQAGGHRVEGADRLEVAGDAGASRPGTPRAPPDRAGCARTPPRPASSCPGTRAAAPRRSSSARPPGTDREGPATAGRPPSSRASGRRRRARAARRRPARAARAGGPQVVVDREHLRRRHARPPGGSSARSRRGRRAADPATRASAPSTNRRGARHRVAAERHGLLQRVARAPASRAPWPPWRRRRRSATASSEQRLRQRQPDRRARSRHAG